ncbi:DNA-3-methyladenine glycosylase family protein [Natrialbaceae archaeon A-gly3]
MTDDPEAVLRRDPVMADLITRYDLPDLGDYDEYERLLVSIINQQLSTASAMAVRKRVFDALEGDIRPETVLAIEDEPLLEAGLSRTKVEYVRNAARAFKERDLTREGLSGHSNEEVIEELTRIRGIGEWTARMYLIFVLERSDVLPLGDLAVRRGIEDLYNDGGKLTRAEMREIAQAWRPYRSLGTRYVWAAYEAEK